MGIDNVYGTGSLRPGVCTSTSRPGAPFEGQLIYETDTDLVRSYDGTSWVTIGPSSPKPDAIAIFCEEQASGTNGGTFTAGAWQKRTLNTTKVNNISGCSIASSVVTLATAGTYYIRAVAPCFSVANTQARLQNTTAATTAIPGTVGYALTNVSYNAPVEGTITVTTSTNYELQHRCFSTVNTNGFAPAANFGTEVYSTLFIARIA